MKKISFHDGLYDCQITYLIGGDANVLRKYLHRKYGKDEPLYSWGTQFKLGEDADTTNGYQFHVNALLGAGEHFYVWVHEASPFLLAHETYHLTGDILYVRGIPYTYSSEEAYAYLYGWIFENLYKKLKGKLKK